MWRSWLHCCDACDAGPNQECSVIFFFLPAAYCFRAALLCRPGGWRAASRLLFLCPEPQLVGAAPAMQRDRAGPGRVYEFRPVLSEVLPCLRVALAGVRVLFCASQTGHQTNVKSGSQRSAR